MLVEHVLSQVVGEECLISDPKILDPACESGIFPVEAFRRIVRFKIKIQNNAKDHKYTLTPDELREILRNQIRGIEINEDAVHIAAFSLYLALLHYQEPPDIMARRLPKLIYDQEYEEGIHRFILEEKGYGKGSESGAMVAYIENMEFEDILRQVNEYIAIRSLSSTLPSSATGWQHQGVTRFNHALIRSFSPSIFSLEHFWLDLRDCQMLPMQHRKLSGDKVSIEPNGQEVIQLELDLTVAPKADNTIFSI